MGHVEVRRRLVEQQDLGLLREHHSKKGALALAARERLHLTPLQVCDMRDLHGPVDGLAVFLGILRAEVRAVGKAAAVDEAPHRHVRRCLDALRQYGEPARERLPLELADIAPRQQDFARGGPRKAREQAQKRRLTRAVRPDDGRATARFNGER